MSRDLDRYMLGVAQMNADTAGAADGRWSGIGRLESVPLREVWRHEAHDFSVWLEDNIDVLGDIVGLSFTDVAREQAAGAFSVDLVATDDRERTVVIENQLERSDHDHLGKLVTYLAMRAAAVAVWIVRDPRPEHVEAVTWLNKSRDVDFYLLKLEAFRIGGSAAAPFLTLITGPTEDLKEAGDQQRERSERHHQRQAFWTQLLASASGAHTHSGVSAGSDNWLDAGSGISGLVFHYRVRKGSADVGLLIQTGDKERNEALFDRLLQNQMKIETRFDGPMRWERKPDVKKCEVVAQSWEIGLDDVGAWPDLHRQMVESMSRLSAAVRPFLLEIGAR